VRTAGSRSTRRKQTYVLSSRLLSLGDLQSGFWPEQKWPTYFAACFSWGQARELSGGHYLSSARVAYVATDRSKLGGWVCTAPGLLHVMRRLGGVARISRPFYGLLVALPQARSMPINVPGQGIRGASSGKLKGFLLCGGGAMRCESSDAMLHWIELQPSEFVSHAKCWNE